MDDTKCKKGGKSIFVFQDLEGDSALSSTVTFPDCKPAGLSVIGNIDYFEDYCRVCTWHEATSSTHMVPALGCKLTKQILVLGDMTISGEVGSFAELQASRVDSGLSATSRHFKLATEHTLELKHLNLTWGGVDTNSIGGCIYMQAGTLIVDTVYFDGLASAPQIGTDGKKLSHAKHGGAILISIDKTSQQSTVTIRNSVFEGFGATENAGALYIPQSHALISVESTTFKDNRAGVSSLFFVLCSLFFVLCSCSMVMVYTL